VIYRIVLSSIKAARKNFNGETNLSDIQNNITITRRNINERTNLKNDTTSRTKQKPHEMNKILHS